MQRTFTIAQTCEQLSVGRTCLYKLIKSDKLKAVKCGRRTLILREDLETFVSSLPKIEAAE